MSSSNSNRFERLDSGSSSSSSNGDRNQQGQQHGHGRQGRGEQQRRFNEQSSLVRTQSAPDAPRGRAALNGFSNNGALLPFSHIQHQQSQQEQQYAYQHQHQHHHSPLQHSFTPPPPQSSESLVALLREQRSSETEPSEMMNNTPVGRRRQQDSDDDEEESYNASMGAASPIQQPNQDFAMEDAASSLASSPAQVPPVKTRRQQARAAKSAVGSAKGASTNAATANGAIGGGASGGGTPAATAGATGEKRSRYLREVDRRSIIHRIDRGEKQSALAKEFGVTRAAICHINKNRVEILMRSNRADVHSGARHPKRGLYTTPSSAISPTANPTATSVPVDNQPSAPVFEVRSLAMALILTKLRRRETETREFQSCTERAFRLLLEEAMARVPTRSIELTTPSDYVCEGLSVTKPSCGVSISEDGFPLLQVFRSIQPTSPSGFITLNTTAIHEGVSTEPTLQKVCVPPDLRAYDVFLLEATCATGAGACMAIQALLDFGAQEASIHLVCLLVSALAVSEICSRFPSVHIVTGSVDPEVSEGEAMICPGLGNFTERYFNATVVHHTRLGANVNL